MNKFGFTPLEIQTHRHKRRLPKGNLSLTGFTLIEITIALLILAVGLVGILTLFPVGFDASVRAANITKAAFLAQGEIEDLKREGYNGTIIQQILSSGNYQSNTFASPYDYYDYEIYAADSMFASLPGLQGKIAEVTVKVFWPAEKGSPGDRGKQRSVELKTYIAKYEP